MKASELIVKLTEMIDKHGDLEIGAQYDAGLGSAGINDVVVVAGEDESWFMTIEED